VNRFHAAKALIFWFLNVSVADAKRLTVQCLYVVFGVLSSRIIRNHGKRLPIAVKLCWGSESPLSI
jgi:hypothetical protein